MSTIYIPIYLSALQYLVYLVYLSIFLSDFLNLINSSRPNFSIFSHCSACTMKDGCSKGDHTQKLLKIMFYQIDFWTVQNCRVFFSFFINTIVVLTEFWDTLYRRTDRETNLQMGGSDKVLSFFMTTQNFTRTTVIPLEVGENIYFIC